MKERRKFVRIKFLSHVELVFNGKVYEADLLDLSLKGALLQPRSNIPLKIGDICYFKLDLSGRNLILDFTAQLVHTQQNNLGFKFLSIDLDTMIHLRRLLELNLSGDNHIVRELTFLAAP